MSEQTNNKTIAKNTLFLYFRMMFTMVISLFTPGKLSFISIHFLRFSITHALSANKRVHAADLPHRITISRSLESI